MGYQTDFTGRFTFRKPLTAEQVATLREFCETRHEPKTGEPSYYCQWVSHDGRYLQWGGEKFYEYTQWLKRLAQLFFIPWDTPLEGQIRWKGEEFGDAGVIYAEGFTFSAVPDVPGKR